MIELVPGHGICLTKRQLDAAHMNAPTPSRLIRNLMGVFFTPETLAISSACGNRVNPALDKDIVETCICKQLIIVVTLHQFLLSFQIMFKQSLKVQREVI